MAHGRGVPGIPRGRGGFGRGGRGGGGFGTEQPAGGGSRGRGRGVTAFGGGYELPNGLPQVGYPGGGLGPPTGTVDLAPQAPSEDQYQQKGSRARRSERRKEKKLKEKQKEEGPPADLGGGDDSIMEIDFEDMDLVFGPTPGAASNQIAPMSAAPYVAPPHSPTQAQIPNVNRGGVPQGRGRGRGGRGGFHPTPQPGHGGYLAQGGKNGGYTHTDFDLQQYAYPQASSSTQYPKNYGPTPQSPRGKFQPHPKFPFQAGGGGRRNQANFRGFAYDDDADGVALRKLARKGLGASNNMYLKPVKFVKSSAILFQDREEIFAAEVADNDAANPNAVPTAVRVEQVFHGGVKPGSGLAEQEESEGGSRDASEDESTNEVEKPVAPPEAVVATREEAKTTPRRLELTSLVEAAARLGVASAPDDDGDDIVLLTPTRRRTDVPSSAKPAPITFVQEQVQVQETEIVVAAPETTQVEVARTEVTTEVTMEAEPIAGPSTTSQPAQPDTASDELIASLLQVEEDSKVASTVAKESKMLEVLTGQKRAGKQRGGGGKRAREAEEEQEGRKGKGKGKAKGKGKGKGKGNGKEKEKINPNARPKFRNEDIFWSTASSEAEGKEEGDDDDALGGMDIDPELAGPSHNQQYSAFVDSVLRTVQENQVSAADLEAEAAMEEDKSDEEEKNSTKAVDTTPSDPSKKQAVTEEIVDVVEGDDDGDDAWTDASDSDEPGEEVKAGKVEEIIGIDEKDSEGDGEDDEDEDDEDDDELFQEFEWDEEDDDADLVATIQTFLDENADILQGGRKMKKEKRKVYRALRELVPNDELIERVMEKKSKKKTPGWVPPDLADQWEKDRQKKAENKRKRAEARRAAMEAEALGKKRTKKLKIRLEAMEDDSDVDSDLEFELDNGQPKTKTKKSKGKEKKKVKEPPKPKFDVWKINRQILGFVGDRVRDTLQLPPMDKDSRRRVHEIAKIYGLTSQSSGKGDARATTLRRTSKTQPNGNERKLEAKLRNWENALLGGKGGDGGSGGPKGSGRHREGDIVGEHAAKIGSENVGYQLLQMMGWSEGDKMGVTGGLEAPIHAVFKATKLGLGSI